MRGAALAALLVADLAACAGQEGTIAIEIVTAPGSDVLDDVTHVRMVLSDPYTVVEADREPDGSFDLAIDVIAEGPSGEILFQGFDDAGALLAYGRTPPLPIAAIDASIAIYVAPPRTLAAAPVELGVPRSEIGTGFLEYGILLAGGRDAAGAPTSLVEIYNAYDHALVAGEDLPEPRAGAVVATGISGYAYVFGGVDAGGDERGTLWRFDPDAEPDGEWFVGADDPALARAGTAVAPIGSDAFILTGAPVLLLEGLLLRTTPLENPGALSGGAASVQIDALASAPVYSLFIGDGAGSSGITLLAENGFEVQTNAPPDAVRTGHAVIPTVDDRVLAVAGGDSSGPLRSIIDANPLTRSYTSRANALVTGRTDAAVAASSTYLLVAGGRDATGAIVPDAELLDVRSLAPIATIPMVVPRAGAIARPLPNQQILILGGVDAAGAPVSTIELFTPDPPELE